MTNPLRELSRLGQSVWYDGLKRDLLSSGALARLVREDGVSGLTTNPTIYEKAIAHTHDYDDELAELGARPELGPQAAYERLAVHDIQAAADVLRPVYDASARRDGYACLEVSPGLAHDAEGTVAEARRLWRALDRENVMIKVPGNAEAVPAIAQLLSEGINVNVTLLFAREAYARVARAHLAALEARDARGEDVSRVASVASFFVSRIDAVADAQLDQVLASADTDAIRRRAQALRGRVAIANAKLAYQDYKALTGGAAWARLRELGAQPQRLLWASTGAKDPRYRDVMYVEELVGPETVDTMPPATLDAFRDHGRAQPTLEADVDGAGRTLAGLAALGISLDQITEGLLAEGIRLFSEPFQRLMRLLEQRRAAGAGEQPGAAG